MIAFTSAVIAYGVLLNGPLSQASADWGTFGDFIGGMAGTVIALATLVALVVALQLQAKELEETRQALRDQVAATRDQLQDVRRYETRRVRPILKAEWFAEEKKERVFWRITNVGLGPCILDSVDFYVDRKKVSSHEFDSVEDAHQVWREVISCVFHGYLPPIPREACH